MTPAPKNIRAPGVDYFTPIQDPPAGTAISPNPPTLFSPITIRSQTFQNRIWVAPMCTFSADKGHLTPFHFMHLGGFAFRGASLTIIEATSVLPNGGIAPEDSGLWQDSQIAPIRHLADYVHSQGQKLGLQLAHAGRKASTVSPLIAPRGQTVTATEDVGGWPNNVWGPSPIKWGKGFPEVKEMTIENIKEMVAAFGASARRGVKAGVDVIEIHAAHGYLLSSFLSPLSNKRKDRYGGSFEGRTRLLIEVIKSVRAAIPEGMPLLLRVSSTEWMESEPESWDVQSTVRLAKLLPDLGVDLLDVSSGGNMEAQKIKVFNDYQVNIAAQIRSELRAAGVKNLLIGAVGMITDAEVAKSILDNGKPHEDKGGIEIEDETKAVAKADIVLIGRQFLREPEWVLRVAHKLGVKIQWPTQYTRGRFVAGSKI